MTLDLPSSFEDTIEADREWADSLIGKKSKRKEKANGKHKRKKEEEDDDGVVVVTDLRPLADRLHEKLEQAAAARKRKSIDPSDHPLQRSKGQKRRHIRKIKVSMKTEFQQRQPQQPATNITNQSLPSKRSQTMTSLWRKMKLYMLMITIMS